MRRIAVLAALVLGLAVAAPAQARPAVAEPPLIAGEPVVGKPSTGGRGSIYSGALEQSNVNLSTEFIKMMAAQRSFQANSKTINTADALLSEIIALKRG